MIACISSAVIEGERLSWYSMGAWTAETHTYPYISARYHSLALWWSCTSCLARHPANLSEASEFIYCNRDPSLDTLLPCRRMADLNRLEFLRTELDEVRAIRLQELKRGADRDKQMMDALDKQAAELLEEIKSLQASHGELQLWLDKGYLYDHCQAQCRVACLEEVWLLPVADSSLAHLHFLAFTQ